MAPIDRRLDDRLVWVLVALLLAVHASLAWVGRDIGVLTAQDDARYVLLSRSLRALEYRDLWVVGQPPHIIYPPGYPALLTFWAAFTGESFPNLVVSNVILSTAALALAFVAIRRIWSPSGALICLTCLAVNPSLIARSGSIRSEALYMFLSLLALLVLSWRRPSGRLLLVAGAAAILAGLTRTIGVSLLGAIALYWLLHRRYKPFWILVAVSSVTVGAWLLWSALAPAQLEGLHYLSLAMDGNEDGLLLTLVHRLGHMILGYGTESLPYVLGLPTVPGNVVDNVLWSVLVLFGVLAGLVQMLRRWPVVTGYLVLYGVALALWTYLLPRFLEPVLPLILATVLLGLGDLASRWGRSWGPGVVIGMAIFMLGGSLAGTVERIRVVTSCGPFSHRDPPACVDAKRASFLRALSIVEDSTPADAVFVTAKPEVLFYYQGRQSILLESTLGVEPERYHSHLVTRGVDYVLLSNLHINELEELHPRLEQHCDAFSVEAFVQPATYLLRVEPAGGLPDEVNACGALEEYARTNADLDFSTDSWHSSDS